MINSKGEEVICEYDFQECDKCERDCVVGMISRSAVEVERVPELEKKLNEMLQTKK